MSSGPAAPTPFLAFPVDVGPDRALATTNADGHLRDLVLQVLLTQPGERLNRPEFGCGITQLLFAGANDVLRATAQFVITQSLERWLGDAIVVEAVDVTTSPADEGALTIEIVYSSRATQRRERLSMQG